MNDQPCCACRRVACVTTHNADGTCSEHWECDTCHTRFMRVLHYDALREQLAEQRADRDRCLRAMEEEQNTAQDLFKQLAARDALVDKLKLEAKIHAQAARTANATIAEIYQCVSGATGEPGNWHGAEPVRAAIDARDRELELLREVELVARETRDAMDITLSSDDLDGEWEFENTVPIWHDRLADRLRSLDRYRGIPGRQGWRVGVMVKSDGWALRLPNGMLDIGSFARRKEEAWGLSEATVSANEHAFYQRGRLRITGWQADLHAAEKFGYRLVRVNLVPAKSGEPL